MSKILVIAGMHRSGTSLITRWLNCCGLFVGDRLAGPEIGNTDGLFEDEDFQQLHKRFLRYRNCSPIGFEFTPFAPLDDSEKQQLQHIIERRQLAHHEWGWKDPITCLFLDAYRELVPAAHYIFIVRDFRSAVSSLVTREHKVDMKKFQGKKGLSRIKWKLFKRKKIKNPFQLYAEKFLKVWIHYHELIIEHVRLIPESHYVFVHHSQLIQSDRKLLHQLTHRWKFSLHHFPFSQVYKQAMISEVVPFEKNIRNKELLYKAEQIEKRFREMLFQIGPDA